jgi:hypothetical protein
VLKNLGTGVVLVAAVLIAVVIVILPITMSYQMIIIIWKFQTP